MDYLKARIYEVIWLNSFKQELSHIYNYLSKDSNDHLIVKKFHKKNSKIFILFIILSQYISKNRPSKNVRRITIDKYVVLYTVDEIEQKV